MELNHNKRVVFDELTHTYELDGKKFLMGVTTLLKKHGLSPSEYANIPEEVLMKAACRGTAVHHLFEDYDNGEPVAPYDVRYEDGTLVLSQADFEKVFKAYKKLGLKVIASEYLVSDNELIASSIDKVIATDVEDEFVLDDVKTTSTIHKESVSWQLSIYAYLFEKANPGAKVVALNAIHARDGKAKEVRVERISDERVEALLQAEKEGRIYTEGNTLPTLTDAISEGECEALVELQRKVTEMEAGLKEVKAEAEALKERIYDYMLSHDIEKMGDPLHGYATLKRPYERKSLDAKMVEKLPPEVYEKALKVSLCKGSVTFKAD